MVQMIKEMSYFISSNHIYYCCCCCFLKKSKIIGDHEINTSTNDYIYILNERMNLSNGGLIKATSSIKGESVFSTKTIIHKKIITQI